MSQNRNAEKDTRHKGGRAVPDVTLDCVLKDLIKYFKDFKGLQDVEKHIKKKYENLQNTTPRETDDIIRAWGKTQRMYTYSESRKKWSLAILLQVIQLKLPDITDFSKFSSTNKKRHLQKWDDNPIKKTPPNKIRTSCAGSESQKFTPEQQSTNKNITTLDKSESGMTLRSGTTKGGNLDSKTRYIRIPLSVMDVTQGPTTSHQTDLSRQGKYKLTDGVPLPIQTIKKTSYVVQYDNRTRNAAWVFEILNKETIKNNADTKQPTRDIKDFFEDQEIHTFFRACDSNKKIAETKYIQKGHLAAAANYNWNQQAMNDTFFLSNMSPQVEELNKGPWIALENRCRDYTKKCRNVYVYTGPLYCPNNNNKECKYKLIGDKAVPTHFFKVVILEYAEDGKLDVECYIMPNNKDISQNTTVDEYKKYYDISDIEKLSGILFTEKSDNVSDNEERVIVQWKAKDESKKKQSLNIEMTILPSKNS